MPLNYLDERGVTAQEAAAMIGAGSGNPRGGMKQVLVPASAWIACKLADAG